MDKGLTPSKFAGDGGAAGVAGSSMCLRRVLWNSGPALAYSSDPKLEPAYERILKYAC